MKFFHICLSFLSQLYEKGKGIKFVHILRRCLQKSKCLTLKLGGVFFKNSIFLISAVCGREDGA